MSIEATDDHLSLSDRTFADLPTASVVLSFVVDHLSTERATIEMANGDETMKLVSWLYDHASVDDVDYAGNRVTVDFVARPSVAERARANAGTISEKP